jgi:signal transduction histidine kinase
MTPVELTALPKRLGLLVLAALSAATGWAFRRGHRLGARAAHEALIGLRETEASLRASESRMAALLEEAPAAIAIVRGPNHIFELANAGYRQLVGGRDVVGKPVAEAVPELRSQGVIEMLDRVLETREPFVGTEVPVRYARTPTLLAQGAMTEADLEEHFINFVYQPILDHDGKAIGVFAHGVDVTTQVRARAEVEAARETAEAANTAKSQFLAVMSHELRTPLNAVLGYTELMEMGIAGPVTSDQLEYHARVRGSSQHLLTLINELLDLSKIEAGHMDVSPSVVALERPIEAALQLVRPQATARHISLTRVPTDEELSVFGDDARIRQILLNLLSNAVKFTDPGGSVTVEIGESRMLPLTSVVALPASAAIASGNGASPGWVYIRVRDTGHGIAGDMLDTIFQPFVQVAGTSDSVYRRSQGGTGLGLAISRRLARLMRGDVTVESEPGRGSTFTLWLPLALEPIDLDSPTARAIRAELGRVLGASVTEIVAALASRVRHDPAIPLAQTMSQTELEDHIAGYLADFAQQLVILDDRSTMERSSLVRDGVDIRQLVAERHGAQRARYGWSEKALDHELDLLRSETEAAARRGLRHLSQSEIEDVTALVRVFLREAHESAMVGYRRELNGDGDGAAAAAGETAAAP